MRTHGSSRVSAPRDFRAGETCLQRQWRGENRARLGRGDPFSPVGRARPVGCAGAMGWIERFISTTEAGRGGWCDA